MYTVELWLFLPTGHWCKPLSHWQSTQETANHRPVRHVYPCLLHICWQQGASCHVTKASLPFTSLSLESKVSFLRWNCAVRKWWCSGTNHRIWCQTECLPIFREEWWRNFYLTSSYVVTGHSVQVHGGSTGRIYTLAQSEADSSTGQCEKDNYILHLYTWGQEIGNCFYRKEVVICLLQRPAFSSFELYISFAAWKETSVAIDTHLIAVFPISALLVRTDHQHTGSTQLFLPAPPVPPVSCTQWLQTTGECNTGNDKLWDLFPFSMF